MFNIRAVSNVVGIVYNKAHLFASQFLWFLANFLPAWITGVGGHAVL
jgi:hypothetical protein